MQNEECYNMWHNLLFICCLLECLLWIMAHFNDATTFKGNEKAERFSDFNSLSVIQSWWIVFDNMKNKKLSLQVRVVSQEKWISRWRNCPDMCNRCNWWRAYLSQVFRNYVKWENAVPRSTTKSHQRCPSRANQKPFPNSFVGIRQEHSQKVTVTVNVESSNTRVSAFSCIALG